MGYLFIFLLLTILQPASLFGEGIVSSVAGLVVLVAGCIHYFPLRFSRFYYVPIEHPRVYLVFGLFLLLLIISLWRTHSFLVSDVNVLKNSLTLVLLPVFLYLLYQDKQQRSGFAASQLFLLVLHVLGIFCLLNIAAFLLDPSYLNEKATLLPMVGIRTNKILFPLYPESHPNMIGAFGGYLFVMGVGYLLHVKNKAAFQKTLLLLYVLAGLTAMFMGDSRGTLFGALLTVAGLVCLIYLKKYPLLRFGVFVLPFSHMLFILVLQLTASTSFMTQVSRNGSGDVATGNSRKFIYEAANAELEEFKPLHLVGYGEYGLYGAGLTKYYMKKFGYEAEKDKLISSVAHNASLQAIFDVGYIGLLLYLLLLYAILSNAHRLVAEGQPVFLVCFYFLVYYMIIGISESNFGIYSFFQTTLLLVIASYAINTLNAHSYTQKQPLSKQAAA